MAFLGGGGSQAAQNNKLLGYPTQTSLYGVAIPLIGGTRRIAGNVIYTADWTAIAIKQGGKGSKGKGGAANQQYNYQTAIAIAFCAGPIFGVGDAWLDRSHLISATSTESFVVPGGGGTYTVTNAPSFFLDRGSANQASYSVTHTDYGSPGSVTLSGVQGVPMRRVPSSPGAGQYTVSPLGVYGFSAADAGKTISITYTWSFPTADAPDLAPLTNLNLVIFVGTLGQSPWSYTTSKHPDQAIGYSETAYAVPGGSGLLQLGQSGLVSNLSLEIFSQFQHGGGIIDTTPDLWIPYFLADPLVGIGFPSGSIGDVTELGNYSTANGLFISPLVDSQQTAANWLQEWLLIANSETFWSEGLMKFRTYGDTTAVGNGATFTPNTQPIYDLDDDDFIVSGDSDPVTFERASVRDAYNDVPVEWSNRANAYNTETLNEVDDWHAALYGPRQASPLTIHSVCLHNAAVAVANTQLKRNVYIRNVYSFKLGWWADQLEPMDMVTITDPNLGLIKQPVRILKISEDKDLVLTFQAEEFPWGTARPTLYAKQVTGSFGPGYFSDPGTINAPIFFEPPVELTQGVGYVLNIGLSGGPNWGGCDVYVSVDGTTYENIGKQQGPATTGVLTALLAGHLDPDDTDTLSVDLTQSLGVLPSYTKAQEDAFQSLILVDGELISYRTATLTGSFQYNITHLRRGVYGTPITSHQIGAKFTAINGALFAWDYVKTMVGMTLFFKFTSYNGFGQREQSLANVTPYQYRIRGPRFPYPWQANYALGPTPWYGGGTIGVRTQYIQQADGTQLAGVILYGNAAKNVFSKVTIAPSFTLTPSTTGGSINNGVVVLVGITAIGSDGLETEMSPLQQIVIPGSTATNKIGVTLVYNDPTNDLGARVYFATPDDSNGVFQYGQLGAGVTTTDITALTIAPNNYVDPLVDSYLAVAQIGRHHGIWGGIVTSEVDHVGGSVIGIGPSSNWGVNSLIGRTISIFSKNNNTLLIDRAEYTILSNTANTVRVSATAASIHVSVDDVVVIRTLADTFSATTIGDSLFANLGAGGSPTGLATNAEAGAQVLILHGTGQGQINTVLSNTGTVLTFASAWTTVPDATSVFIILSVAQPYTATSLYTPNSSDNTAISIFLPLSNTAAQSYFITVSTVDDQGNTSQPTNIIQYFREVFVDGLAGTSMGTTVVPYKSGSQL